MNRIIKNIELDLDRQQMNSEVTAHVKQTDNNSRELVLTLRVNNTERPVQPDEHLRLRLKKPDGKAIYADLPSSTDGKVHVVLTDEMLSCSGLAKADIEVSSGETILSSFMFYLDVEERVLSEDSIIDTDEYGALQSLISSAESAIESCESAADGVNEAKEAANTAATGANAAKDAANSAADEANTAAGEANTQAQAALQASVLATQAAGAANTAADRANEAAVAVEDLDLLQLVQRINELETTLMPQSVRFWRCEDGQNYLELWAVAQADMVWYYAVIAGLGGLSDSYTTDDGELTDLKTLGGQYLPAVTHDGSTPAADNYNATFIAYGGNNASISVRLTLLNMAGTDMTDISINTNGDTTSYLVTPGVLCLGCCKNLISPF